jgi:DNA-binding transcriptional LysR family regulator
METKSIEAFLALANCLNFTKCADQVYISQPALSRQILRLEEEFDCKFFIRNKRKVELTEHGRAFSEYAQRICAEIDTWKLHCKYLQGDESKKLRIGFLQDFPHTFFPRVVQAFSSSHPEVKVSFFDLGLNAIIDGVLRDDLDCGFSLHYEFEKFDQINSMVVSTVRMCAILPVGHALADRKSLKMEELVNENFITISAEDYTQGLLHTQFLCKIAGFEPNIIAQTKFVPSMLLLVKCGVGIALAAQSARNISPGGIRFVPISDKFARIEILFFWRKTSKNPAIPLLVKTAESLL